MRFSKALLLGSALVASGVEAGGLGKRQAVTPSPGTSPTSPSDGGGGGTSPTDGGGGGGSTTPGGGSGGDTTVFVTQTVTDNNVATVTSGTTVFTTITSTVVVTKTAFTTTTVTSRDQDTATKTIWETSTQWANKRRAIDLAPRTVGPAPNVAVPTATPEVEEQLRRHYAHIAGRAVITKVNTVTVGNDAKTTVFNSVTQTVISTKSSDTTITNTVTETDQADAKTTVTVTSTLTITSTAVTTGVLVTTTAPPSGSYNPGATSGAKPDNNANSGDSSGLSTGAKAGIGVGAAAGGIAVIAIIVWFIMRSRRRGPKPDPDDLMGASEVPVGGPVGGGHSPMSHHASSASPAAAAFLAPGRSPVKPAHSPEGYRGTAMGDGRAGYAKPDPYGAAYTPSPATGYSHPTNRSSTLVSGGTPDHLPEHPMPAEMDSAAAGRHGGVPQPHAGASEMDTQPPGHQSPPSNVYEMPATNYR